MAGVAVAVAMVSGVTAAVLAADTEEATTIIGDTVRVVAEETLLQETGAAASAAVADFVAAIN